MRSAGALLVLFILSGSTPARAEVITLERVLALARDQAPEVVLARARTDEARARRRGAAVLLAENPELLVGVGPRFSGGVAVEAELTQSFPLAGGREARLAAAEAGIEQARAASQQTVRAAQQAAAGAFLALLHGEQRLTLARATEALAAQILSIAERRFQAGDVPVLHVHLTRAALARARSLTRAEQAAAEEARARLRALLGLPAGPLTARGSLADRARFEAAARAARGERPELLALAAQVREAEAEERLARQQAWPVASLGIRFLREDAGEAALLGLLGLRLPIFERSQGPRAEAASRARRLRTEEQIRRRRYQAEVIEATLVYRLRVAALAELERGLPDAERNEALARRSYERGELGLSDLLLARREALETRAEHLQRQLEAALAGVELLAASGGLP